MLKPVIQLGRVHCQTGRRTPFRIVQFLRPILDSFGQSKSCLALQHFFSGIAKARKFGSAAGKKYAADQGGDHILQVEEAQRNGQAADQE